jgi:hypothetical protein
MLTQKDPRTRATPPIILKMRKYVLAVLGVTTVLNIIFYFHPIIGSNTVIIAIGLAIGFYWLRKNAGTVDIRKMHYDTDKSFILPNSFERTIKAVPVAVARNRWKLVEGDDTSGHFQVKIGISMKSWGAVMLIDVSPEGSGSSKVNVHCSTQHQIYDYGKNYSDITKLHNELLKELG